MPGRKFCRADCAERHRMQFEVSRRPIAEFREPFEELHKIVEATSQMHRNFY